MSKKSNSAYTTDNKTDLKAIMIVVCLVLLAVAYVCGSPERGMLYFGKARIKGTVSVYLDNDPLDVSGVTVTDVSRKATKHREVSFDRSGNTVTIIDEAGEKTRYEYELDIPECDRPVTVSVWHTVYHRVTRFECELYLIRSPAGVSAEYRLTSKASNKSVFEKREDMNTYDAGEKIVIFD